MKPETLLLTGATGYIGGSILHQLLHTTNPAIKALKISLLVRDDSRNEYYRSLGLSLYTMDSLDDHEALVAAASQHDIVLHAASGYHPPSAASLIAGLAKRQKETGRHTHYLQQDGTSNFGDRPITQPDKRETRIFSDLDPAIYDVLRAKENIEAYPQRTTALGVVDDGLKLGVDTTVVTAPNIYGSGTGKYNQRSIQIPLMIREALKARQAVVVGHGEGVWDFVHIEDLALLWEVIVADVAGEGGLVPKGKTGFVFTGVGRFSWGSVSEQIGKVGKELGLLDTDEVKSLSLEEAAVALFNDPKMAPVAELALASTSRTQADVAKKIGWKPQKSVQDFYDDIKNEVLIVAEQQQKGGK